MANDNIIVSSIMFDNPNRKSDEALLKRIQDTVIKKYPETRPIISTFRGTSPGAAASMTVLSVGEFAVCDSGHEIAVKCKEGSEVSEQNAAAMREVFAALKEGIPANQTYTHSKARKETLKPKGPETKAADRVPSGRSPQTAALMDEYEAKWVTGTKPSKVDQFIAERAKTPSRVDRFIAEREGKSQQLSAPAARAIKNKHGLGQG